MFVSPARRKRKREKKHKRPETDISVDELMDTATFKKFSSAIDSMLEAVEDVDLTELNAGKIQSIILPSLCARM